MNRPPRGSFPARLDVSLRQLLWLLILVSLGLTACEVVHQTAVGSYQVATAPLRLFHHSTPTPTPAPTPPPAPPTPSRNTTRKAAPHPRASASPSPKGTPKAKSHASPTQAKKSLPSGRSGGAAKSDSPPQKPAQSLFPTARPVPDKAGYVFSPSQPTKYVDVSGYTSGSKVKDPYSGQIFIVP